MAVWSAIPILGAVLDGVFGLIDKGIEDKDEAARLKAQLSLALRQADLAEFSEQIKAQAEVVLAEARGESWLQRSWRPILMLCVVAIIANNYILFPYLSLIFPSRVVLLDLPERLWDLLMLGVGGYVVGRSGEKMLKEWKK